MRFLLETYPTMFQRFLQISGENQTSPPYMNLFFSEDCFSECFGTFLSLGKSSRQIKIKKLKMIMNRCTISV